MTGVLCATPGETVVSQPFFPAGIVPVPALYQLGQDVPNWYGTTYIITGVRLIYDFSEDWESGPEGPDTVRVWRTHPACWEYQLTKLDNKGTPREWGWEKEWEITKYIAERPEPRQNA